MTTDKPIHILARLEVGFRTDAAHLKELEQALAVTLLNARQFGRKHGSPDDWTTNWDQQWDNVDAERPRVTSMKHRLRFAMLDDAPWQRLTKKNPTP